MCYWHAPGVYNYCQSIFLQKKGIIGVPFSLKIEHKIKRGSFSKARWVAQKLLSKLRKTCYARTHTNTTVGSNVQERQSCYLWQQISPMRCGSSVIKTLLNDAQVGFKIPSLPFLAYISVLLTEETFLWVFALSFKGNFTFSLEKQTSWMAGEHETFTSWKVLM